MQPLEKNHLPYFLEFFSPSNYIRPQIVFASFSYPNRITFALELYAHLCACTLHTCMFSCTTGNHTTEDDEELAENELIIEETDTTDLTID